MPKKEEGMERNISLKALYIGLSPPPEIPESPPEMMAEQEGEGWIAQPPHHLWDPRPVSKLDRN